MKNLLSLPDIFAELINVNVFQGKTLISPENLKDIRTEYPIVFSDEEQPEENNKNRENKKSQAPILYIQRYRDVIMETKSGFLISIIFAGEAQHDIDFTMPQRLMLLNSLEYEKQIRVIQAQNEQKQIKIPKTQRIGSWQKLTPIISFVIYTGSKPWPGPGCLFDMFDLPEQYRDELQHFIADSPMILVDAGHMEPEEISKYSSDFRIFLEVLNHIVPKSNLTHPKEILDALRAIGVHKREMEILMEKNNNQKEESSNMVTLFDVMFEQGIEKGIKALILDNIEGNVPKERIIAKLQKHFSINKLEAEEYYNRFSSETV